MRLSFFIILLGLGASTEALTCRSGFNVTMSGIPMYQWYTSSCSSNSKCFGQEVEVLVTGLKMTAEYGGCVSSGYSDLITCQKLFGPDSDLDPAQLLNLIPELDKNFRSLLSHFQTDTVGKLQTLFSGGKNTEEFISGCITFYENLGFNVANLRPLEPSLTKLFNLLFAAPDQTKTNEAVNEFLAALGNLNTDNAEATANIKKFLQAIGVVVPENYMVLVNKLPGLIESTLPSSFQKERWFNVIFQIMSKLDVSNPKKTVQDMVTIIKNTDWVPNDYKKYTDPFLNSLPELVHQSLAGNSTYSAYWSTLLLKEYSSTSTATMKLSQSVINFLAKFNVTQLDGTILNVINYLPGHFYNYFPNDRTKIDLAYTKIANGLDSFDFSSPTNTLPPTNMSNFIIDLIDKIAPGTLQSTGQQDFFKLIIINFSHTFYKLMEPDYNDKVDIFFNTLIEGFANFPSSYNAGQMIRNLVKNLGGKVPAEIDPLLANMQNVFDALNPYNATKLFSGAMSIVTGYKTAYPNSLFPPLVEDYLEFIMNITLTPQWGMTVAQVQQVNLDIQLKIQYLNIDFQFALIQAMNLSSAHINDMLASSFPHYAVYIKAMSNLKASDVKKLVKDIATWVVNGINKPPLTSQGFVDAVKPTMEKLTSQLGDVIKNVRHLFSPDSCKHITCAADNCNTHGALKSSQNVVTKSPVQPGVSTSTTTTPSGSGKPNPSSVVINLLGLLVALNIFLG